MKKKKRIWRKTDCDGSVLDSGDRKAQVFLVVLGWICPAHRPRMVPPDWLATIRLMVLVEPASKAQAAQAALLETMKLLRVGRSRWPSLPFSPDSFCTDQPRNESQDQ